MLPQNSDQPSLKGKRTTQSSCYRRSVKRTYAREKRRAVPCAEYSLAEPAIVAVAMSQNLPKHPTVCCREPAPTILAGSTLLLPAPLADPLRG